MRNPDRYVSRNSSKLNLLFPPLKSSRDYLDAFTTGTAQARADPQNSLLIMQCAKLLANFQERGGPLVQAYRTPKIWGKEHWPTHGLLTLGQVEIRSLKREEAVHGKEHEHQGKVHLYYNRASISSKHKGNGNALSHHPLRKRPARVGGKGVKRVQLPFFGLHEGHQCPSRLPFVLLRRRNSLSQLPGTVRGRFIQLPSSIIQNWS